MVVGTHIDYASEIEFRRLREQVKDLESQVFKLLTISMKTQTMLESIADRTHKLEIIIVNLLGKE